MSRKKAKRFFLCEDADSYVSLREPGGEYNNSYHLKMTDCSRSIEWEFYVGNKKAARASLKKLSKFRDMINTMHEEMEARVNG